MPIHDWTRVKASTWHDHHVAWTAEIRTALNDGLLPEGYYAQAEQIAGPLGPDVLALQDAGPPPALNGSNGHPSVAGGSGGIAVALAPPRLRFNEFHEMDTYASKRSTVVIRHSNDDRIVALMELVSPGNKTKHGLKAFVEKAVEAMQRGYHLFLVDLFPPGRRDPHGIHAAVWEEFSESAVHLPPDEPLTLATYSSGTPKQAWIEPTAVGRELIDMPLFLDPETYVNVPLEPTYRAAYRGVPKKWKAALEA